MNIKQAMMLTAMLGTVPDAADRDESIAFVAFEAFMEKKTYGRGLTIERITYPLFHNVHDIRGIQPRTDYQDCTVSADTMVVVFRSGGSVLVSIEEANRLIIHIRKLQGY